jgi:phage-related baseplate assembly protein
MKNDNRYEDMSQAESDHDTAWRERIQRALRDLRSASSNVARVSHAQPRGE